MLCICLEPHSKAKQQKNKIKTYWNEMDLLFKFQKIVRKELQKQSNKKL